MATSYAVESNLPGLFGTDLNQINVQREIADTEALLKQPGLNANDRLNANNYLASLKQKLGTKYDSGTGSQSIIDKYFGTDMATDPAGETGPYIGTGNRWNRRNVDTVNQRSADAAAEAAKKDTLWDKFGGLIGNVGLVVVGIAITGITIYFAAKKVGES